MLYGLGVGQTWTMHATSTMRNVEGNLGHAGTCGAARVRKDGNSDTDGYYTSAELPYESLQCESNLQLVPSHGGM